MPASTDLALRAPFDAATFLLPAEWHSLAELLGADTGLLMLQDGQIRHVNPVLADHLGFQPDELAGQLPDTLIPPEEIERAHGLAEGETLMLCAKWGARVPFRVLENRLDPMSEGRCSILVLKPLEEEQDSELALPDARLLAITEQLPDMVLVCDPDAGIRYANRAFGQLAGAHGDALLTLVHHDDRARAAAALERAAADDTVPLEMRIRRADGGWSHVAGTAVNLLSHPDVQGLLVNVRDVSEEMALLQRSDSARKRQLHYLNRLLRVARRPQSSFDGALKVILKSSAKALGARRCAYWEAGDEQRLRCVLAYDDVRQNYLNEASGDLFARAFEPLLQRVLAGGETLALDDVDRDPRAALYCDYFHEHGIKALLAAPVMRAEERYGVLVLSAGDGRAWHKDEIDLAGNAAGLTAGVLADGVRSRTDSRLRDGALQDRLTRLPNGGYLRQQASEIFPRLAARSATLSAFVVDLDGFTEINRRYGRSLADDLLKAAALRLRNVVRRDDLLVRLEGDAFLLLACDLDEGQVTEDIAQQISDSLRNAFSLQGQLLQVSASVGIARYPEHGEDLETLLKKAGDARYQAKEAGRGQYRTSTTAPAVREDDPASQLKHAMARHELLHYYQPRVDLRTGAVRGVEALLRWAHPQHGLLLPASFLPLAEKSGCIPALSAWAVEDVARRAANWSAMYGTGFPLVLKVSLAQFADGGLLGALDTALRQQRLPARAIECEFKETALRHANQATLDRLRAIAGLGVTLTLDEFGGDGLEALSKQCPIHKVKIDASPAGELQEGEMAIADRTIAAAHALGLEVVAKGVETSQQVDHLRELGCDIGLGYYYTPPLTADQLEKWLTRR